MTVKRGKRSQDRPLDKKAEGQKPNWRIPEAKRSCGSIVMYKQHHPMKMRITGRGVEEDDNESGMGSSSDK